MEQLPNIITVLRIVLVFPTAWMLWESRFMEAFVLVIVAGLSDALDGFLARKFNWMSRLGAMLDPLADKFLVAAVFVVFTLQGHIPLWVAIIVLLRDFIILAGAGVYKMLYEEVEIAPTFVSKASTATQIVTLALLLASLLLVPVVELVNSAVEAAVDRHGPERHPLSGRAKDAASAAVLGAIVVACLTWLLVLTG